MAVVGFNIVLDGVKASQLAFRQRLQALIQRSGSLSQEQYVRYLSMQFHLTNGVQKHFFQAAAHPDIVVRKNLREFLYRFGVEEEPHFQIALKDLQNMKREPLPRPLYVQMWWMFFDNVVRERPFVRLGATCVLENLSDGAKEEVNHIFSNAPYITPKNFRFFAIHKHEDNLNHGEQILEALQTAKLSDAELADVVTGINIGSELYMRMVDWVLDEKSELFAV
jgi:hypothetical protein